MVMRYVKDCRQGYTVTSSLWYARDIELAGNIREFGSQKQYQTLKRRFGISVLLEVATRYRSQIHPLNSTQTTEHLYHVVP